MSNRHCRHGRPVRSAGTHAPAAGRLWLLVPALSLASLATVAAIQGPTPTFRARTELVRLDVRATDAHGVPVTDLRPEEITVTENGKPRPVLLFRHLTDEHPIAPPSVPGELTSNAMPSPGHLFVLVFDQLHIAPGHEQRACVAAEEFLRGALRPGDAVAVYGLPGPGPMVSLTTDLSRARAALGGVRGRAGRIARPDDQIADVMGRLGIEPMVAPGLPSGGFSGASEVSNVLRGSADEMLAQGDNEVDIFLTSLASVLEPLRWIEGRKNVILFSEGFTADRLSTRLDRVAAASAESYSVINTIDLSSWGVSPERAVPVSTLATLGDRAGRRESLAALAAETSGVLVADTNAQTLQGALGAIVTQAEDYYLLGFEPDPAGAARTYSRVNVRVKRPGVVAHARSGYSMPAELSAAAERQAIDAALFSPKVSRGLSIEYTTYQRAGPVPDQARVLLSLTARVRASAGNENADVVFVVRDGTSGVAVASGTDHVRVTSANPEEPAASVDMPYSVQFDVPPGEYVMRVLVRDPGGVIGTADRRFRVWPLNGPGVTTSDLIVARLDRERFDAPTRAMVGRGDQVLAYVEMYGPAPALEAATARVDVLRAGSDAVVASVEGVTSVGNSGERVMRASLPVAGLEPGEYAARVRITAPNQGPRTLLRTFDVQ